MIFKLFAPINDWDSIGIAFLVIRLDHFDPIISKSFFPWEHHSMETILTLTLIVPEAILGRDAIANEIRKRGFH